MVYVHFAKCLSYVKELLYSSAGPIDYNATKPLVMAAKAVNISSKNYKPAGKLIAQTIYNTHWHFIVKKWKVRLPIVIQKNKNLLIYLVKNTASHYKCFIVKLYENIKTSKQGVWCMCTYECRASACLIWYFKIKIEVHVETFGNLPIERLKVGIWQLWLHYYLPDKAFPASVLSSVLCCLCHTVKPVLMDHCHERPPVLKDQIFLTKIPRFHCNWTCHQRPPVLRDHFYAQCDGLSRQVPL